MRALKLKTYRIYHIENVLQLGLCSDKLKLKWKNFHSK